MAETAFQIQYRQSMIDGFEARQSLLRDAVTTEAVVKGNTATFLVADSGGASAVTRGVNGLIPARADNQTQTPTTLREWHDLVRKTGFNVFASQGNQIDMMQRTTMGVINRKIDSDIITELNTATITAGASYLPMSMALMIRAKTILGVAEVPFDGNVWALITPAAEGYLLQSSEFSNADYVTTKPIAGADTAWNDKPGYYKWLGLNIIVHPNLPGVGGATERCFMWHKNAVGHAVNTAGIMAAVGYDEEQDYSFCRATVFMGTENLQNSGIVVINHDGSAFAAV